MSSPDSVLLQLLREKNKILLLTHHNPDGDALGSLLGLADILDQMGKQVLRYLEAPIPAIYRFLPTSGQAQTDMAVVRAFVAAASDDFLSLCLDCGDEKRLGKHGQELLAFRPLAIIDHHQGNSGFGEAAWIDPERSSTGEMIVDLSHDLGVPISSKAAQCLYAAISSDTGSFQYASTSSHTFQVAAHLAACGADPASIANHLYDNYSLGRIHLMQEVLSTLELYEKDRIAFIRVSQGMLERSFTTMEDTEQFINFPRAIHSVRVAVFMKEIGAGLVSVSLRAKGQCDVAMIARQFGGGGHKNASGCRVQAQHLDTVRDALLPLLIAGVQS